MKIEPFRGIRYNSHKVSLEKVVAPPYDVISPQRQEELYELSPANIVRLILGKEHPGDDDDNNRYSRAAVYLKQWLEQNILARDERQAFYIYEQSFTWQNKNYLRTGIIARVELRELGDGIYPHEKTMSKVKKDRYQLTAATEANFDPIFALYESKDNIKRLLTCLKQKSAGIDIVDDRGISDKLWVISDEESIGKIKTSLEGNDIFIADGHHRYETALKYHKDNPQILGASFVMMALVEMSDEGLVILPAHRVVSLGLKTESHILNDLGQNFDINLVEPELEVAVEELKDKNNNFVMVLNNRFYKLKFRSKKLLLDEDFDVSILHRFVLEDILDIKASSVEDRVFFTKSAEEAIRLASAPKTAAFLLRPTPLSALKKIAAAHKTMPQKSTYFYPKLLTGLVINSLGD